MAGSDSYSTRLIQSPCFVMMLNYVTRYQKVDIQSASRLLRPRFFILIATCFIRQRGCGAEAQKVDNIINF